MDRDVHVRASQSAPRTAHAPDLPCCCSLLLCTRAVPRVTHPALSVSTPNPSHSQMKALSVSWAAWTGEGNAGAVPKENQDAWLVHERFGAGAGTLLGVFDGHGASGRAVSHAVMSQLPRLLAARPEWAAQRPLRALEGTFPQTNRALRDALGTAVGLSGCTAVVAHISGAGTVSVASVGDSRALVGEQPGLGREARGCKWRGRHSVPCRSGCARLPFTPRPLTPALHHPALDPPALSARAGDQRGGGSAAEH